MTTFSVRYDHPSIITRQQHNWLGTAGASAVLTRFVAAAKCRVRTANARVHTAGTTAGNDIVYSKVSGTTTTSVGTAVIGTSTAGVNVQTDLNTILDVGDMLLVVGGTDATGVRPGALEWHYLPDALFTK